MCVAAAEADITVTQQSVPHIRLVSSHGTDPTLSQAVTRKMFPAVGGSRRLGAICDVDMQAIVSLLWK